MGCLILNEEFLTPGLKQALRRRVHRGEKIFNVFNTMRNQLTSLIIKSAIEVHNELGPGLLEQVYLKCLFMELENSGLAVQKELALPVYYKGTKIDSLGYRIDLLVDDLVVVELKSVQKIEPVHKKQLLTYLRLTKKEIGLLINFNEVLLKDGIHRIVNSAPRD